MATDFPTGWTGRRALDRLLWRPYTPVVRLRRFDLIVTLAPALLFASLVAHAQQPGKVRIGASPAQTGAYAAVGQNQLRGYQLCVKHLNERGGVLGRQLELLVYDDGSDAAAAVRLYEKLITQDKVDLVLGPYSGPITDAVADVTEKHKMPMVAPSGSVTSMYRKGRKFIFSMLPPAEVYLEGLLDLAAKKGLKTVALINVDQLFGRAVTQGAIELAKGKGLQVVFVDAYPLGTTDFSTILTKVRAANPDVLGGGTYFEDAVAITRQLKALNVNPRMAGLTAGVDLPKFYEVLGRDAEFVYGATAWVPELVALRAGGLIPIARQYPGAREFVESYKRDFPGAGADLSFYSASGYGACQILVEAIRRAGSLNGEKLRDAISKMDHNTVFGGFRVDRDGIQIGHKMLLIQWQDGKKVIVWPEELAPGKPRFPTPPWGQRP
jgi:branched-chain amino acid transport system substrate-binding protein